MTKVPLVTSLLSAVELAKNGCVGTHYLQSPGLELGEVCRSRKRGLDLREATVWLEGREEVGRKSACAVFHAPSHCVVPLSCSQTVETWGVTPRNMFVQ